MSQVVAFDESTLPKQVTRGTRIIVLLTLNLSLNKFSPLEIGKKFTVAEDILA